DDQQRARAAEVGKLYNGWIAFEVRFLCPYILDVRDLFGSRHLGQAAVGVRMYDLAKTRGELRRRIVERNTPIGAVLVKIQGTKSGLTDLRCAGQDRLEHRLQVARR